jgi:hypothetical protein
VQIVSRIVPHLDMNRLKSLKDAVVPMFRDSNRDTALRAMLRRIVELGEEPIAREFLREVGIAGSVWQVEFDMLPFVPEDQRWQEGLRLLQAADDARDPRERTQMFVALADLAMSATQKARILLSAAAAVDKIELTGVSVLGYERGDDRVELGFEIAEKMASVDIKSAMDLWARTLDALSKKPRRILFSMLPTILRVPLSLDASAGESAASAARKVSHWWP